MAAFCCYLLRRSNLVLSSEAEVTAPHLIIMVPASHEMLRQGRQARYIVETEFKSLCTYVILSDAK